MKKLIAAISFILYFIATTGVVINSHYCMKKLVSVHLFETKTKVCGQCGMEMHDNPGCCHDETKVVKLEQDQVKIPVAIFELPVLEKTVADVPGFLTSPVFNIKEERHFHNHSPPLLSAKDIYLLINVFRI